jgi:hypothetical protein
LIWSTGRKLLVAGVALVLLAVVGSVVWQLRVASAVNQPAAPVKTLTLGPTAAPNQYTGRHPLVPPATLPVLGAGPLIGDLKVGQTAYSVPQALWIDANHHAWLALGFRVTMYVQGNSRMLIGREVDGYHVWISLADLQDKTAGNSSGIIILYGPAAPV